MSTTSLTMSEIREVLAGTRRWTVAHGSMLDLLPLLPDDSLDACVVDPPYEIAMMGRAWDRSGIAVQPATWQHVLRVLKPGAHLLAFGGTRTFHRIACAIEDAGFEIRDDVAVLSWIYSTGFPKSVTLAKGVGTGIKPSWEPVICARKKPSGTLAQNYERFGAAGLQIDACRVAHASPADLAEHQAQVEAIRVRGGEMGNSWKNASDLSGANEVSAAGRWPPNLALVHTPWCRQVGTKPVAANPTWNTPQRDCEPSSFTGEVVSAVQHTEDAEPVWLCVPGCAVLGLVDQASEAQSRIGKPREGSSGQGWGMTHTGAEYEDSGSRTRYFPQFGYGTELDELAPYLYCPKSARSERDAGLDHLPAVSGGKATHRKDDSAGTRNPRAGSGRTGGVRNTHPTPKPVALMRWLVKLVTPPGGVCLDCFTGSGTTGIACMQENVRFLGIELLNTDEEPFVRTARARIAHMLGVDEHASPVLSQDPKTGEQQMSLFAAAAALTRK